MRLLKSSIKLLTFFICSTNFMAAELPTEHRWSDFELATLKTLWLGNLKLETDKSNRVANNSVAVELGHKLFFDTRLSRNGEIACVSCHQPDKYFTDGLDTAKGIKKLTRNAPTIVGSRQHTWFFHDGRADSLWSQALGPLENALEHGGNRSQYAHIIFNDAALRKTYELIFGVMPNISNNKRFPKNAGPVKDKSSNQAWKGMANADKKIITDIFVNIGKVIAAYESQLQPAASRFDNYVKAIIEQDTLQVQTQLSLSEVKGLRIFISKAKCTVCHSGPMFTDKGFHNISIPPRKIQIGKDKTVKELKHDWGRYKGAQQVLKSPFNCRGNYNDTLESSSASNCDELEYMVMDQHETQGAMKTPSLRNVAKTAPYMHGGQFKTLAEVIKHYDNPPPVKFRKSELFLNFDLDDNEVEQLEAFLKSLNSPIDAKAKWLTAP